MPVLPDALDVAVDPATGDDDGFAARLEILAAGFEHATAARDVSVRGDERLDAVIELQLQLAALR